MYVKVLISNTVLILLKYELRYHHIKYMFIHIFIFSTMFTAF